MINCMKSLNKSNNECINTDINIIIKCAEYSERVYEINKSNDKITFINDRESDVECILITNKNDRECYIVFRGTSSITDWKHDLNILKVSPSFVKNKECKVHKGFYEGYMSIRDKLLSIYNIEYDRYIFSGHSYGGSLCTLASIDCALNYNENVYCISFGSPRVGDKDFVKLFDDNIKTSYRCVYKSDPVALLPSYLRFRHVRGYIYLTNTGKYIDLKKHPKWFWNLFLFKVTDHNIENYRKSLTSYLNDSQFSLKD